MSSLVQHKTGSWADPSSATFDNPVTQGNLVVAVLTGRSGEAATAHVISGTGWVPRIQRTVNQADLTYRRSMSLHTKVAGASQPQTITGAGGVGSSGLLSIYEYKLDTEEDQWTFLEAVSNDNGTTTNGDTISTGATSSLPGDKIFLLGVLGAKSTNYSNPPTVSWSDGLSLDAQDAWGYQQMGHSVASATVATAGVKSSTASYSPLTTTQNDGLMAGLLAFKVADAPANQDPTLDSTSPDTLIDADAAGSYDHSADFSDADSDPLTFSASPALPTGFSLNSSTGVRSWDGSQIAGVPTIHTISADDGQGGTAAEDEIVIGVCPAGKTWITGAVAALTGLFAEPEFSGLAIGDIIYAYWSSGGGTFDPTNGAVAGDVGGGELTIYVRDISDTNNATAIDATPFVITVPGPDTEKPVITLTGPATVNLDEGDTYTEQGATWTDNVDGSGAATVGGDTVDTNTPGTYVVTYDYTDAAGNAAAQVTRIVNVLDASAPTITLLGSATVTHPQGSTYSDAGAAASDAIDGDITGDITVTGLNFDVNTVGSYTIRYNVSDSQGNAAAEVTRTVNVTDQTAPVITLAGGDVTVPQDGTYSEPGYTATDNNDGDITVDVVVGGDTVDTSTPGVYTITYNVTDAAGNAASQRTRTVTVTAGSDIDVDYIPRLLATDIQEVTLFAGRGNRFRVTISHDGIEVDLSAFTRFELHGLTTEKLDSVVSVGVFDTNDGGGVINIDPGSIDKADLVTQSGTAKTTLIGYTAAETEGVILWHPMLAQANVTVNIRSA